LDEQELDTEPSVLMLTPSGITGRPEEEGEPPPAGSFAAKRARPEAVVWDEVVGEGDEDDVDETLPPAGSFAAKRARPEAVREEVVGEGEEDDVAETLPPAGSFAARRARPEAVWDEVVGVLENEDMVDVLLVVVVGF
jgi:hypothetical protein